MQPMKIVPRRLTAGLMRHLRTFPAVLIVGPRQCGKSTLSRSALPDWSHFDLERPIDLDALSTDPEGFFDENPGHVVIDEAQRMPSLFPLLRHVIDRTQRKGRFVLLGSASPDLLKTTSESLAGRLGILELTPFRSSEMVTPQSRRDRWFWGGFPPVHGLRSGQARNDWMDSYVAAFLERDLPSLGFRLPADRLRRLLIMLTHVHGSLLNVSDLARSLTESPKTVDHHLDVLEGAFMIRRLPPYFANVQKRLTKSPKVYIRDSGILHFLAGLRRPDQLETWPKRGHSFEGLVIEELIALAKDKIVRPEITFWRTQAGAEVDLLIGDGRRRLAIEIKLGAAVDHHATAGLRQCMKDLDLKQAWIVSRTPDRRSVAPGIELVPWDEIASGKIELPLGR
jgi:predicted AAA+ superfamily ATPase